MPNPTYVVSDQIGVAGTNIGFHNVIERDDVVVDLTGRTIQATVRQTADPLTVIHADLEDISVVSSGVLASGEVIWTLDDSLSAHLEDLCPENPAYPAGFFLQYYVVEIGYRPQMLRFHVRRAVD